jgi:hypothetical protein
MNSPLTSTIVFSLLLTLMTAANAEERAIDAAIEDLQAKADRCGSIGATECERQCRALAEAMESRYASTDVDHDVGPGSILDSFFIAPCKAQFEAAEAPADEPTIADVEGTFQQLGRRGAYVVEAEGRESDWVEICGGSTRVVDPGNLGGMPAGTRVRLINITYEPGRVGHNPTPCMAERAVLLE